MSVSNTTVKLVPLKISSENEEEIYVSKALIERLGISNQQHLEIRFGKKHKVMNIQTKEISPNEIHLSETIINEFFVPLNINNKFLAKYISTNQTLYLGPIAALLTDFHLKQKDNPHFGSIHIFCEELHQRITEVGGLFYVFSIDDFSDKAIGGFYFENGAWHFSKQLPLPDVIYNRIHSRRLETISSFKSFRGFLERKNIPLFNDRYLSKWEVYQQLILDKQIQPYIPETRIFSANALNDFLNKYDLVYLKPVHGSQGKNIFKLIKEEGSILCQTSQSPDANQFNSNQIFCQLKPLLHNKIYIIQQGIPFTNYKERAMDFRVLVHKNQYHLWEVTSLVARVSAEKQFVSNLAKGGTAMKPYNALNACFDKEQSLQLIKRLKELALQAAAAISSQTAGIIGELGIDIGVDLSGNPWIIEANSKPSKSFEDTLAKIRPSAKAIIQFCTKLAFDGNIELEEKT